MTFRYLSMSCTHIRLDIEIEIINAHIVLHSQDYFRRNVTRALISCARYRVVIIRVGAFDVHILMESW